MEVVAGQLSDPSASKTDSRKQRFQELQARKNQLEVAIDQTNANLRSVQLALSTTMRANPVLRVRAATVQLASHLISSLTRDRFIVACHSKRRWTTQRR